MSEFETQLNKCQKLLYDEPVVKEYFRLKKIVQSDEELVQLDKDIHHHQQMMCVHKNDNEIYLREKKLYDEKLAKFKSNPLVENYFQVREEVYALLNEVKEIIE